MYDKVPGVKPSSFDYVRPTQLDGALRLLGVHADEAKVLAGGQSLIPMMNLRLARPQLLIDLAAIEVLAGVGTCADGVRIGATSTQTTVINNPLVRSSIPVLVEALGHVAHRQIRNRGTIGGSLAHADPAAEFPALAVALDAVVEVASLGATRTINARDLLVSTFTTALHGDEMITGITFPAQPRHREWGFKEIARRPGDFALAGAVVSVDHAANGDWDRVRAVLFAAGPTPVEVERLDDLAGSRPTWATIESVARRAVAHIDAPSDGHANATSRLRMLTTVLADALATAGRIQR
jgi:carbon-monoxide dehydrogenase medium subunit